MESVYSKRIRAGKRRTYFFDVRETRGNDYYLTITESRKRFDSDGYDRHKIFLYKEDFNKFLKGLGEAIDYVKTDLMPDFDFDAFNHDTPYEGDDQSGASASASASSSAESAPSSNESAATSAPESETPATETPAASDSSADDTSTSSDDSAANSGTHEEVDKW